MIRPYLPEWMKRDDVTFALELTSALFLGAAIVQWWMT
jgi:hypothetical protein